MTSWPLVAGSRMTSVIASRSTALATASGGTAGSTATHSVAATSPSTSRGMRRRSALAPLGIVRVQIGQTDALCRQPEDLPVEMRHAQIARDGLAELVAAAGQRWDETALMGLRRTACMRRASPCAGYRPHPPHEFQP
jgi:hypothetical protein